MSIQRIPTGNPLFVLRAGDVVQLANGGSVFITSVSEGQAHGKIDAYQGRWYITTGQLVAARNLEATWNIVAIIGGITR